MCVLTLFINPFYVLILGAIVEKKIILPNYINYFIAFSIAFSISNREIGNYWFSISGDFAEDDALNYLSYFHDLKNNSFILNYKNYLSNFFEGREPLWFFIAEIIGYLFFYNDFVLIFISIALPVFILHKTFREISPFFCINSLLFYILIPESFHTIYHLWRFSLSSSILYYSYIKLLKSKKIPYNFIILSISAHLSAFLLFTSFYIKDYELKNRFSIFFRFYLIILQFTKYIIFVLFAFFILPYFEFEKFSFYFSSDIISNFIYNIRHLLYLFITIFFIFRSDNIFIINIAILNLFLIILPALIPEVGLVMERILIITTPTIPLMIAFQYRNSINKLGFILVPIVLLFIYLSYQLSNKLFYQYISNGNFFSFYNGIFYNMFNHH